MHRSAFMKLIAVLIAAILVHAPSALGACNRQSCIGPCSYDPLVYNHTFNQVCDKWKTSGGVTITTTGGGYATIPSGTLYQDVLVSGSTSSYSSLSMTIWISSISGSSPGTERFRLAILTTGGSILETVDVFWPSDSAGQYDYDISNYSGQTIRVQVTRLDGSAPGNTTMVVDALEVWGWW